MFHIMTNIELMFENLDQAMAWTRSNQIFLPKIPQTAMREEDQTTPRICAAPKLTDCVTAIGATGTFRRCLNANECAKSYENDNEAYPVIVVKFDDDLGWKSPKKSQVPDVRQTHEKWLLRPAAARSIEIRWLDAYSIEIDEDSETDCTPCTDIKFLSDLSGYHHPWLDGKGHFLDSSCIGDEDDKNIPAIIQKLYYDPSSGGRMGFIVPAIPPTGICAFYPADTPNKPYKTFIHRLRRFTGFYDETKQPILDRNLVLYKKERRALTGTITTDNCGTWIILPTNDDEPVPLAACPSKNGQILQNVKSMFTEHIPVPEWAKENQQT